MNNISSPRTDDAGIEQEIQAKGLTAPRVTTADIEANIMEEHYFLVGDVVSKGGVTSMSGPGLRPQGMPGVHQSLDLLTFCVLVLRNGFTVTGESACASPENFDAEIGRKVARANAIGKCWPLLGYALKSSLAGAQQ